MGLEKEVSDFLHSLTFSLTSGRFRFCKKKVSFQRCREGGTMLRPCQLVSLLGTVFLLLGEVGDHDDEMMISMMMLMMISLMRTFGGSSP